MDMPYRPSPIDTSGVALSDDLLALCERLAANTHEVWAAGRVAQGWVWGPQRSDSRKETPCLVPYGELPESEKEYDRRTAMETIRLLVKWGYGIVPPEQRQP